MRHFMRVFCSSVLLFCSSAAYAADMIDVPDAPPMAGTADTNGSHDWSGGYVGVTAGYQIGKVFTRTTTGNFPGVTELRGLLGGINAGYNVQDGSMVYGVEGDVNWSNFSGDRPCAASAAVQCNYSIDLTASLRGRIGFAVDQVLIFGAAGLSAGRGFASVSPFAAPMTGESSATLLGLTIGGGVEYALSNSISLKAQYDYVNWSDRTSAVNSVSIGDPYIAFPTTHAVRAGVNYKF